MPLVVKEAAAGVLVQADMEGIGTVSAELIGDSGVGGQGRAGLTGNDFDASCCGVYFGFAVGLSHQDLLVKGGGLIGFPYHIRWLVLRSKNSFGTC